MIKNYIYNLVYQLLTMLLPIITIPYTSRVLKAEGLGSYVLTNTYAQYFVIFGMVGLSMYSSREIAYARDNNEKLSRTFWSLNILRFITMGIALLLYIVIFWFIVDSNDKIIYMIQTLVLLSSLIDISWLFIGLENFKKVVVRNTFVKVIGTLLTFLLVKNKSDVWIYTLILGSTQFIGQIIMCFEIPKEIKFIYPKKGELHKHLKGAIALFIPQIAITIYTMLDKVMLGAYTNEAQVGIYDNSQKVIRLLVTVVTTLGTVAIPKMSNLYKNKQYAEFEKNVYKSFSFVSFLAFPMCFGLIGICRSFIPWFYGQGFQDIYSMFYVGSFIMITLGWSSIVGSQVLISIKRERQFTIAVTAGAVINLILNFILIGRYGGLGATISTIIAEYTGMFLMVYFLRDLLNVRLLFKPVIKYLMASLIMFFIIWAMCSKMNATILSSIILAIVGAAIYFAIMVITKDENLLYALNFVKEIRRKKLIGEAQ